MSSAILAGIVASYLIAGTASYFFLSRKDRTWLPDVDLFGLAMLVFWPVMLGIWFLRSPGRIEVDPEQSPEVQTALIGKIGIAASDLRPWGQVVVAGQSYEARVESGHVAVNGKVVVVRSESKGLVVRGNV